MGGPALHVAYLSAGLKERGYDTTLVAGSLALGEESMAGVAEELGGEIVTAPREKSTVGRLGIEVDERVGANGWDAQGAETRRQLGIPADRFVVGWIGRMTGVKRTDDVLLTVRRLREQGVDAVLCMVGDGPDRDAVEKRAHDLGIVRES